MFRNNKSLFIIALIVVVNALGYGIIIPIIYSYSQKFGLSDFQNGLLFSVFSLCQFLSTPVIGRFSDVYGRKPMLVISLIGTVISFVMMAFAPSAIFLFIARALDGLTAGNFPVAMAVISDTTKPEERARGFGIIGAAFGFGFVFGPAISALTVGINPSAPFLIAAAITTVAVALTWLILPETNKNLGTTTHKKLFDFPKLVKAVLDKNVGTTLLISLIFNLAFGLLIYAYQPFSVKILGMHPSQVALTFTLFGIVGLITQMFIIPRTMRKVSENQMLINALIISATGFFGIFLVRNFILYIVVSSLISFSNAFVLPLVQTLLSKETDEKSQGEIMGVSTSYQSVGLIFGPIIGGLLASFSIPMPFFGGGVLILICVYIGFQILNKKVKPVSME